MNFSSGKPIRKNVAFVILILPRCPHSTGRVFLWIEKIAKKGVNVAEVCSDDGEYFDLVRRSDGAVASSFKLRPGDRVLLNSDGLDVGHKHLQADERVIARDSLVEIVRELTANN